MTAALKKSFGIVMGGNVGGWVLSAELYGEQLREHTGLKATESEMQEVELKGGGRKLYMFRVEAESLGDVLSKIEESKPKFQEEFAQVSIGHGFLASSGEEIVIASITVDPMFLTP